MTPRTAEARAAERANQAFYDAVETSDLDALEAVVLTGPLAESVTVVHPGWPVLRGRREVMRSYALIMANTEYIQFFLTDVEVAVDGDTALVSCTENILTGGPAEEDGSAGSLVGGLVVATNVFRRTPDGWRLWVHHGSPVLADDTEDGADGIDDGIDGDGRDNGGGGPRGPDDVPGGLGTPGGGPGPDTEE
ncbi:nuclear transport factor 2 family protein [Actinacidiphila sp. ITFR-21]|uniref:nuclear transport factor 2 family protein n=1 Tax=Actinacidiphila sp. ITFR-21 TaxID=3075199 RepID=UPI002889EDBD|nr:nuclear transport factor 2 family protein [Streptomyces sp. ITFR-21]WNI16069.1 nuclear transport factor 2 family protein [Streptomyces sp. ITFR-21]